MHADGMATIVMHPPSQLKQNNEAGIPAQKCVTLQQTALLLARFVAKKIENHLRGSGRGSEDSARVKSSTRRWFNAYGCTSYISPRNDSEKEKTL